MNISKEYDVGDDEKPPKPSSAERAGDKKICGYVEYGRCMQCCSQKIQDKEGPESPLNDKGN